MVNIFLSYSKSDQDKANQIALRLQEAGFNVFKNNTIGIDSMWKDEINESTEPKCMVVLLSPHTKESVWVNTEIRLAHKNNLFILPVLIDGDVRDSIPPNLKRSQFIDVRHSSGYGLLVNSIRGHFASISYEKSTNKNNSPSQIFISYQRQNQNIVENLVSILQDMNHTVWYDQHLTSGHKWWDGICAEIRNCDLFITALSPTYLDSEACRLEYEYAYQLNKRILPIEIVKIRSYYELPVPLQAIQVQPLLHIDDSAKSIFTTIFEKLPPFIDMPNPLPKQPDMPVHPLSILKDQAEAKDLGDDNAQRLLIAKLEDYLFGDNESDRELARKILINLKKRKDILYATGEKIARLLK